MLRKLRSFDCVYRHISPERYHLRCLSRQIAVLLDIPRDCRLRIFKRLGPSGGCFSTGAKLLEQVNVPLIGSF